MSYLLATNNLTKQFKAHKAVDSVSLHLKKGDIYGFIGRNGAGKTTFLKMISGLSSPTSGDFSLFGESGVAKNKFLNRIGLLIEDPGLYFNMTAYDNLNLKCICVGIRQKGYIESILELVGLADTGKKKVKDFSLGMKQRLGIGMALVGEPDLMVLDEPINGLDPQGIAEVRDTILKLNKERNITFIISSHILEELTKICTDYGIIHHGRLIKELDNEGLKKECSQFIEVRLDAPEQGTVILEKMGFKNYKMVDLQTIHIYERIEESSVVITEFAKNNLVVQSVSVTNKAIEDYFLELTGDKNNG